VRQDSTSKNSSSVPSPPAAPDGIGALEHLELALVHVLYNHRLGQRGMAGFALEQEARDHADHLAARLQGRIGEHAHQADAAAAVNQGHLLAGEKFPRFAANSRLPEAIPKRAPQKTQIEEGRGAETASDTVHTVF
jgi:hypothetical protein